MIKYQPISERALPVLSVTPFCDKRGNCYFFVKWQLLSGEFRSIRLAKMSSVIDFVECNIK